jgi:hypothetical protein
MAAHATVALRCKAACCIQAEGGLLPKFVL